MGLRKLGAGELTDLGINDPHDFKLIYKPSPPSHFDIFIDTDTKEIVVADKKGNNPEYTGKFK